MCYLDQKGQRGWTDYSPEKIHYLLQRVAFVQLKEGQNYQLNHLSKATHVVCESMKDIHWSHNVTKSELDWFDKLFNIYFILAVVAVILRFTPKRPVRCFIGAIQHVGQ